MGQNADDIVRLAWRELPRGDRDLLKAINADQWQVCRRPLGVYTDELLRSADRGSLSASEIARANAALALWVPELRVVLINEGHPAFDGLSGPTLTYDLSRVAWHEWGHALSLDRAREEDIAAGERYVGCCQKVSLDSSGRRATVLANIRMRSSLRSTRC